MYQDKATKPQSAVIYLRVSSEEQVDNYSLATQEDICKKEAERRNIKVLEIFREEGRSAKNIKGRPALIEMLEYCRKHRRDVDAVIVYRLDRISRQTADYLAIRKKLAECEILLISATEPTGNTPTEKFIETMLAGFAQMDNDVKSERSRNGLRARFLTGLTGYVPVGYVNKNGYAAKDPATFDKLKEAWDLMATGTISLRQMTEILHEKGVRQRHKGGHLRQQALNRLFRNKFYAGYVTSKKYQQEIRGQHTPMVTEEQFYRVQTILDGRNTNITKSVARRIKDNPEFPLRRLVSCSGCGASFTGAKSKGKRKHYSYYFCPKRCGTGPSVPVEVIEQATLERLSHISLKPKTIELLNAYIRRTYFERIKTLQKRREHAEEELKKLYQFRQALIEKNIAGIYSDDVFREQNEAIEEKIKDLQLAKSDGMIEKYNLEAIAAFLNEKFIDLAKTYEESTLDQKKVLLCSINPQGLVWDYKGYSNTPISPFYQSILNLQKKSVSFGAEGGTRTRKPVEGSGF